MEQCHDIARRKLQRQLTDTGDDMSAGTESLLLGMGPPKSIIPPPIVNPSHNPSVPTEIELSVGLENIEPNESAVLPPVVDPNPNPSAPSLVEPSVRLEANEAKKPADAPIDDIPEAVAEDKEAPKLVADPPHPSQTHDGPTQKVYPEDLNPLQTDTITTNIDRPEENPGGSQAQGNPNSPQRSLSGPSKSRSKGRSPPGTRPSRSHNNTHARYEEVK